MECNKLSPFIISGPCCLDECMGIIFGFTFHFHFSFISLLHLVISYAAQKETEKRCRQQETTASHGCILCK